MAVNGESSQGAAKPRRGKGKPFVKGQSGNPHGRRPVPPEVKAVFLAADEKAAEKIVSLIDDPDPTVAFRAAAYVYEANHGKTPQALRLSDGDGKPLRVSIAINGIAKGEAHAE